MRQGGQERRKLDRYRDVHLLADFLDKADVILFDLVRVKPRVGHQRVDIELERVSSGCLHVFRQAHPAAGGHPVQAGNDGDFNALLDFLQLGDIPVSDTFNSTRFHQICLRFGLAFGAFVQEIIKFQALVRDFFLKEGVHHQGANAAVLQLFDDVKLQSKR